MKNKFIIAESERSRILNMHKEATRRNYIIENEEEWVDLSQDIEGESDFSQMETLKNNEDFQDLVTFFRENPEVASEIERAMNVNVNEDYKYYDYSDSRGKQEITKNEYLKRKLMNYGIWGTLMAILGAGLGTMTGGNEVLEAALLMAGMGAPIGAELSASSGREKVDDEDSEM
jgi:hypothetical protein